LLGKNKDGEDVSGTVSIPEVAHDTEEDEYVVRSLLSRVLVAVGDLGLLTVCLTV
jgi:hypothetical protein